MKRIEDWQDFPDTGNTVIEIDRDEMVIKSSQLQDISKCVGQLVLRLRYYEETITIDQIEQLDTEINFLILSGETP